MKFLKTRKYRILSNILKYSFVGVFAIILIVSTIFTKNIVNAADLSVSVTIVSDTTADIKLSGLVSGYNYTVVYKNNTSGETLTKATVKQTDGTAIAYLLNLTPSTSYTISASYIDNAGTKHAGEGSSNFNTLSPSTNNAIDDVSISESNMTGTSVDLTVFGLENLTTPVSKIDIYLTGKDSDYINTKNVDPSTVYYGTIKATFGGLKSGALYGAEVQIELTNGLKINKKVEFLFGDKNAVKIDSIMPMSGSVGDMVTITGNNFIGITSVLFGKVPTITTTNTKDTITAKVPKNAINAQISVSTSKYGSATSADVYLVDSPLVLPVDTSVPASTSFAPSISTKTAIVWHGLVPECSRTGDKINTVTGNYSHPCDFNVLIGLINRFISFVLVDLALPLFALIIIYVAWLYLSSGGSSENITKAKKIFFNVIIGYIIALAAWLIVKTILSTLGFTGDSYLS